MSYATNDKRIAALKDERKKLISAKQDLERRVDELCAEVEAEKQRNAKLFEAAEKWMAKAAHFEAENAKLRELVVTLMACVSVDDCNKCPINGAEFKVSKVRCCREAKQRMQELGIEVYG